MPKFLTQDIQLFNGIISDLFPGLKLPNPSYSTLNKAITEVMGSMHLQNVSNFRKKVLQLYEMVNCRHGIMLVGQTFSGKTTCYKVLANTFTECVKMDDKDEVPAHVFSLLFISFF